MGWCRVWLWACPMACSLPVLCVLCVVCTGWAVGSYVALVSGWCICMAMPWAWLGLCCPAPSNTRAPPCGWPWPRAWFRTSAGLVLASAGLGGSGVVGSGWDGWCLHCLPIFRAILGCPRAVYGLVLSLPLLAFPWPVPVLSMTGSALCMCLPILPSLGLLLAGLSTSFLVSPGLSLACILCPLHGYLWLVPGLAPWLSMPCTGWPVLCTP